ncbi:MAG TPA: hypothetical protein VG965_04110 [Patescibacteria group bacterium]|nr:hypothetical protein [Patescibacteria group bacterium]
MPKKKSAPKKVARKSAPKKVARSSSTKRANNSRTFSFWIGVITIVVIGILVLAYSQGNNYKNAISSYTGASQQ